MTDLFKFRAWHRTFMTWIGIPSIFYGIYLIYETIVSPYWLIGTFLVYQLCVFSLSIGNHRLFSHRMFKCNRLWHWLFGITTTASGNGSTIQWVFIHLGHHMHSDTPLDPHTVTWYQFFKLSPKNINFRVPRAALLLRDPMHRILHQYALLFVLAVPIIFYLISPMFFLFCYLIPVAYHHITGNLFYIYSHTNIGSVDRGWVGWIFPFAGEWNHRYHHVGNERAMNNAQLPGQFDIGYWFSKLIKIK